MIRPIKFLRFYTVIFFQYLEVASLTLFLMALDCQVSNQREKREIVWSAGGVMNV